ncbi:MAG: phosphoribosyltransferase family protein [Legionellales bacterium]|jgi:predicted phosphoribosyltransferase
MIFKNREQAANLLAHALIAYKEKNPLVLGIPRGGVPMARIISDFLEGEMDVILVHKLSDPHNKELAIGSIAQNGEIYLNIHAQNVSKTYIEEEAQKQLTLIRERRALYTPTKPVPLIKDRIVIIVDDGIATGSTMLAAIQSLRTQHPAKLIVATAVGPADTIDSLRPLVEQIICLAFPDDFYAVAQFFSFFPQVSDEQVIEYLNNTPVRSK